MKTSQTSPSLTKDSLENISGRKVKENFIDLRSDTVTKPTPAMLRAMMTAEVGDDVFEDDPVVNALEEKAAKLFGTEAALFCPSGTMCNQIAIKILTEPLCEIICDKGSHVYHSEVGGYAFNSGCAIKLVDGDRGRINAEDIVANINPDNAHYPITRLVVIENTHNKGGGSYYTLQTIKEISAACRTHDLYLHLDGARIFNALTETKDSPADTGKYFDTISFCLSKGLGAPVGSVLLSTKENISRARRIRKVMGGGMRQIGYLAAAGIYALDNNVARLKDDHRRAKQLAKEISTLPYVKQLLSVDTNIIIFKLHDSIDSSKFLGFLLDKKIKAVPFGKKTIRFVTHLDIDDGMIDKTIEVLKKVHF